MFTLRVRETGFYKKFIYLGDLLKKTEMNALFFMLPVFFSLLVALFEGISVSFLVPLANGIIKMDFAFVRENVFFKQLMFKYPQFFSAPNTAIFVLLVAIVFVSAVLKNIFMYAETLAASYQTRKFSHGLRRFVFSRYLSFGKLFFDRHNMGYLQNVLINFNNTIARQLRRIDTTLSQIFMLVIYLVIMFKISWRLTLCVIIIFPVLNYSLKWLIKRIKKTSESYAKAYSILSSNISNILSCISLVKLYKREDKEREHFAAFSDRIKELEFSIDKKQGLISPIQEIIMLVAILLLISAMAFIVVKERSGEIGSFLVFFFVMRRAEGAFGALNNLRASLAEISGPITATRKMLEDKDKFFIPEGRVEFKGLRENIAFKDLTFSYLEGTAVLQDINLMVQKGKLTAIVGPSGSGKTTLISLLLRFYDCKPGRIILDGCDIRDFTLHSLMAHMSLVSQDIWLFNDTVRNNIIYGLDRDIKDEEILDVLKKARLYSFIMSLPDKLDTYIGDRGVRLSGGEKQRVAIARALLKDAQILILDEATSSLDTKTERLIQEAIDEAIRDRTTIVIAHRLSTIKHADKIVVIENGKVSEEGVLADLLERKGKFSEYWQEQRFH